MVHVFATWSPLVPLPLLAVNQVWSTEESSSGFCTGNFLASFPYQNIFKTIKNILNELKQATPYLQSSLPLLLNAFDSTRIWGEKKQLIKTMTVDERNGSFWVLAEDLQRVLSWEQLAVMLLWWQTLCGIWLPGKVDLEMKDFFLLLSESFLIVHFFFSN